jgi:heme exporter protein A
MTLDFRNVGARYGKLTALAEVSFSVPAGARVAVFGHNGAGKTTLLGIVSTLVRPTAGGVVYRAGGHIVGGAEVRGTIGMLAHASLCYGELTARENLALIAGLYDLDGSARAVDQMGAGPLPTGRAGRAPPPRLASLVDAALDRVGLERKARDRAARTYSRGMVQRLALARVLITRPSLVLLDEPFTGLDRDGALALGGELSVLRDAGAIVVVVTHDLEAIAGRTDHLVILRRGQLVFEERGAYSYEQLKDVYHRHAN